MIGIILSQARLFGLFVTPGYRQLGIATLLLKAAVKVCRGKAHGWVRADDIATLKLTMKLGFSASRPERLGNELCRRVTLRRAEMAREFDGLLVAFGPDILITEAA